MSEYSQRIKNHTRITVTSKKTGEMQVLLETKENGNVVGDVLAGIPITECVDESLDSMTFTIKESRTKRLFKPFDVVTFTLDDGISPIEYEMCVLSDHAQTLSSRYGTYTHTVTVIESTKILEKTKIFNLNLTNQHDMLWRQFEKALNNAEPVIKTLDEKGNVLSVNHECRFTVSAELRALLENRPSEDFRFSNTDLRTVLDGILAPCNARVEVKRIDFKKLSDDTANIDKILLGYRSLAEVKTVTPVWTEEEQGAIVSEELSNNGQDYAGKIVARGYNTVMTKTITFTDVFKHDNYNVDSNTASIILPFPISDKGIIKFAIMGNVQYNCLYDDATKESYRGTIAPIDISKRLIPEEQYNILSKEDKNQYISYKIGSTTVSAAGVKQEIFFTSDKMYAIIDDSVSSTFGSLNTEFGVDELTEEGRKLLYRELRIKIGSSFDETKITRASFSPGSMNTKWFNRPYIISYYPLVDTAAEITKSGFYDKDEILLGISNSQTENTLDQIRHGKQLESLIKRTGNDEYYLDVIAKHYGKLLPLMSKIKIPEDASGYSGGDYVLFKRECGVYDTFVKCRYYFSKNFNAVQKVAGVNREKHLYDIPLESDECPIVNKKYLIFGSKQIGKESGNEKLTNTALQTVFGKNIALTSTFINAGDYYNGKSFDVPGKINYMLLKTYNGEEEFPLDSLNGDISKDRELYSFMLPCVGYGQAKQMNFVSRPLDNYSMGYSRGGYVFSAFGDGGYMIIYNRYVSKQLKTAGECDKFKVSLVFDHRMFVSPHFDDDITEGRYAGVVERLPLVVEKTEVFDFKTQTHKDEECILKAEENYHEIDYFKDRTQKPVFCISFECLTAEADFGKIYVGNAFCRENNLVQDNGEGLKGMQLICSSNKSFDGSEDFVLMNEFSVLGDISNYFALEDNCMKYNGKYANNNELGKGSWAIVKNLNGFEEIYGEIYLAVNGVLRDIYVCIKDFPD